MLWPRLRVCGVLVASIAFVLVPGRVAGSATMGVPTETPRPRAVQVDPGIAYGDRAAQEVLDLYHRPGTTDLPIVVLVHGGGWRGGDKASFAGAARALAARNFVVANINYTLGPTAVPAYRKQADDVRAALSWVRSHADTFGGDADRIALVGGSAGGHLAAMVATTSNTAQQTLVRSAVSLSGPMNIAALVEEVGAHAAEGACEGRSCDERRAAMADLEALLGCAPADCDADLLAEASPVTHVDAHTPPFFLANSMREVVPAEQAREMALVLRAHGVDSDVEILPGDEHSMEYVGLVAGAVVGFLEETLRAGDPTAEPAPARDATDADTGGAPATQETRWLVVVGVALAAAGVLGALRLRRRAPR